MKKLLTSLALISSIAFFNTVSAQATANTNNLPADAVTVVIQLTPVAGSKPELAAVAMNDMRAMIRKQPGYLSEEFLQNVNPSNAPAHVHVIRWASLKFWENVFISPEFAKLNAAGSKHYTVTASGFKTLK
jgi:heme-degrading monooxygenase HmoA